jgi:putative transposase
VENCFIESFNGRVRDECLSVHWFETLDEARSILEDWRRDFNKTRPHSSLSDRVPRSISRICWRLEPWPRIGLRRRADTWTSQRERRNRRIL